MQQIPAQKEHDEIVEIVVKGSDTFTVT